MGELYEKQEDGSLRPVNLPKWVIKRCNIYLALKDKGLSLEEIKLLWDGYSTE